MTLYNFFDTKYIQASTASTTFFDFRSLKSVHAMFYKQRFLGLCKYLGNKISRIVFVLKS